MRTFVLSLLLLFSFVSGALAQQEQRFDPQGATYLWPTDASSRLSSTFAETRSKHFHAALDIKTWGRRGYNIFASRDGVIHRIAIGPHGYGKVIYLRHPDESYSIYAHLLGFNDKLQQLADSIRFANDYAFELNKFIGDRNITVKQGEVIGYSGASGIGPPHLHFELRTPAHQPFNPLLTNLTIEDTIAPRMVGLSVEPQSVQSSIAGKNAIYTKRPRRQGTHHDFGEVTVSGPIGLGINVYDQSNEVYNKYAVYEMEMSVNGQKLFTARADSFSYLQTHQMFIDRVYPLLKENREGYQRLYLADGNALPFYDTGSEKGVLDLSPGTHQVSIRTTDFFGNTSTASVQLNVEETEPTHPVLSVLKASGEVPETVTPHLWKWFQDWVMLPEEEFLPMTIATIDSSNFFIHEDQVGINLKGLDPLFMNLKGIGPVDFRRIKPNTAGFLTPVNQEGYVHFPEETFYDTVSVGMTIKKFTPDSIQVKILPDAYPVRKSFQISIKADSALDHSKLSFYKWDERNTEWDLVSTEFTGSYIKGETQSLGLFTTLRDTLAPIIEAPKLSQRRDGQWVIYIPIADDLSGIDYQRAEIEVNGKRGIAEYEPEDDRLVYYHPDFSPSSEMEISVTAFDKMGNKRNEIFPLRSSTASK